MSLAPTDRTKAKRAAAAQAHAAARSEHEDIIDRFVARVRQEFPDAEADILKDLEGSLRDEFKGARPYIRSHSADSRQQRLDKFRTIFNGVNADECARELGIARRTVYRLIKTAGKS